MRVSSYSCPVCSHEANKDIVNRRKALQEHIRRAAVVDPLHRIWKDVYNIQHFTGEVVLSANRHVLAKQ
jgi:hypothetical protein